MDVGALGRSPGAPLGPPQAECFIRNCASTQQVPTNTIEQRPSRPVASDQRPMLKFGHMLDRINEYHNPSACLHPKLCEYTTSPN